MNKFWRFSTILLLFVALPLQLSAQDKSLYLDPEQPVEARVEDLLARMSLDEKIGQMTLVDVNRINPDDIASMYIGAILSGGGGSPRPNTPAAWAARVDIIQVQALNSPLGIPILYGVDAIHGHNNVLGAVIYPHNIGLGATHNPELVRRIGQATACDMAVTGIHWDYAPVVAVPQDIRWGRTYEGYSQDTQLVTDLATAYIDGLQGDSLASPVTAAATPKHFIGDGATMWDTTSGLYFIDEGDAVIDEDTLRAVHLPPYIAAIEQGAMVIMASFSSWNGTPMHANHYLLTDVLKGELGFDGFVVSDWQAIDLIGSDYYDDVVTAINAGIDMNMVPMNYLRFIETMQNAVNNGDISIERVDDAVRRILRVKFMLGLFEHPFSDSDLLEAFSNESHHALARQAVSQSMVLLRNENDVLPLSPDVQRIFLLGSAADDIGIQSGGWTITWQGGGSRLTPGTSIKDAVEATVSDDTEIYFDRNGRFSQAVDDEGNPLHGDVGIVVVGENPYAEMQGDRADLSATSAFSLALQDLGERVDHIVVIVLSGRPLIITEQLELADAWIAAWLPGTEGQGIADVLFGDQPFTGTLSYAWPRSMDQVPLSALAASDEPPLFPMGYGITTGSIDEIPLVDVTCQPHADT